MPENFSKRKIMTGRLWNRLRECLIPFAEPFKPFYFIIFKYEVYCFSESNFIYSPIFSYKKLVIQLDISHKYFSRL